MATTPASVEASVAADATKAEAQVKNDVASDISKLKSDLASLEAKTIGSKTGLIVLGVVAVLAFVAGHLLK